MRLISIGRPLPDRAVDNHTIFNAPALFDAEAIVIDPGGVFRQIRGVLDASGEHETPSELPVVNGGSSADAVGLADLLQRRRDEVTRALERGAVVVVFTYPQATLPEVAGFSGADRYFFLPAPPGLAWDANTIRWGEGRAGALTDLAHPFAAAFDAIRPELLYRAYFDDRAAGFAGAARVFARSAGGAVLGVHFRVFGGHVIFLPTPAGFGGEAAGEQTRALLRSIRELLASPETDEQPAWAGQQPLPGLAEREAEEERAVEVLRQAEERLDGVRAEAGELRAVRDVLWREGRYGLLPAAVRCAELLGFRYRAAQDGEAVLLRAPEGELLLEVEGAEEAVGMAPHYRLRARLDAVIEAEGYAPRGLIIANGRRLGLPEQREGQYTDALRVASEAMRYALLTATELFQAARYALGQPGEGADTGADEAVLAAIRTRLLETDGVVTFTDLLGEPVVEAG